MALDVLSISYGFVLRRIQGFLKQLALLCYPIYNFTLEISRKVLKVMILRSGL